MANDFLMTETEPRASAQAFACDVLAGLSGRPKSIPSAYFYDERGSRLFQRITQLDEYYLTRCEREILKTHAGRLAALLRGETLRVVEIGAGDGHKTRILLEALLGAGQELEYVPIDICRQPLLELAARLRQHLAGDQLRMCGVVAEYSEGLRLLAARQPLRTLVLFLGSSIGNFTSAEARRFLRRLRAALAEGDYVLIGFDLKKDPQILTRAYDDAAGITREFNFNLLRRINRELQGRFDARSFAHHATYNPRDGCMESWLVSREEQSVPIGALKRSFSFRAWEGMQVEASYKYDLAQIDALASSSGFCAAAQLFDARKYFVDVLWRANGCSA